MNLKNDLTGKRFNKLTTLEYVGHSRWLFECDCGTRTKQPSTSVMRGLVKSCGCHKNEQARIQKSKHDCSKLRAYKSWKAMIDRCCNSTSKDFAHYGGRGISVCERWLDVANFIADMGERPCGFSIDRLDPNGNYEPSNCRWATPMDQGQNKRNARMIEFNGVTLHLAQWSRRLGIPENTIRNRINSGKKLDGTRLS